MIDQVQTTRLPNGLTILTEHMPGLRSVSLGIWVRRGSRHESPALNGICHFIEHALFKGTQRRSAHQIATESDRLGGHLDAYTTHEMTGFALKVVDTEMARAFDLLADLLINPRFDEDDLAKEQKVIIEEMKMIEDTPDELLTELFHAEYFPGHSLGRPIEGTEQTVSSFDHATTAGFHAANFAAHNLVIAAAGNVTHEQLVELVSQTFTSSDNDRQTVFASTPQVAAPILIERKNELEQAHLIIAAPWPSAKSDDRYAASMLGTVIGGGTSSRLWQSIREDRGLAYAIGAGGNTYTDVGMFTIYAGTSPAQLDEVLDLSLHEVRRIVREPVSDAELQLAKEQATSSVLLSLESSSARVGALARQEIIHGRRIAPDEIIRSIESVTTADVQRVAQACFTTSTLALGALGNLNGFAVDRARLEI
ncbi:MAG TPA: pitrilysin family protein [Pyrinomonadaceae bacterium]|nr:pitrilysin family protein [Pyrinomonadaceae bacterium]